MTSGAPAGLPHRRLLSDAVHRALLEAVLEGVLEPGERLVDEQLTAWLGVSRTPIRTALESLAGAGLIELSANRFTRVSAPTLDDLAEASELYVTLHGRCTRSDDEWASRSRVSAAKSTLARVGPVVGRASVRPLTPVVARVVATAVDAVTGRVASGVVGGLVSHVEIRLVHSLVAHGCRVPEAAWAMFVAGACDALDRGDPGRLDAALAALAAAVIRSAP